MNTALTDLEKDHLSEIFADKVYRLTLDYNITDMFCIISRGRLISINGRHIWSSEMAAKNALSNAMRKISRATQAKLAYSSYKEKKNSIREYFLELLQDWVNENTLIIHYQDYINAEQRRDKTK